MLRQHELWEDTTFQLQADPKTRSINLYKGVSNILGIGWGDEIVTPNDAIQILDAANDLQTIGQDYVGYAFELWLTRKFKKLPTVEWLQKEGFNETDAAAKALRAMFESAI